MIPLWAININGILDNDIIKKIKYRFLFVNILDTENFTFPYIVYECG